MNLLGIKIVANSSTREEFGSCRSLDSPHSAQAEVGHHPNTEPECHGASPFAAIANPGIVPAARRFLDVPDGHPMVTIIRAAST